MIQQSAGQGPDVPRGDASTVGIHVEDADAAVGQIEAQASTEAHTEHRSGKSRDHSARRDDGVSFRVKLLQDEST